MSDSDGEYVADDLSDDDIGAHHVSSHGTRSTGPVRGTAGSGTRGGDTNAGSNRRRAAWEDIQRSWDTVVEGADGSINSTVEGLREAGKRKRSVAPFASSRYRLLNADLSAPDYYEIQLLYNEASSGISFSYLISLLPWLRKIYGLQDISSPYVLPVNSSQNTSNKTQYPNLV
jgi:hypothetical protein